MAKYLKIFPTNNLLITQEQKAITDHIIDDHRDKSESVIVVQEKVQRKNGWTSEATQAYLADKLEASTATTHAVITFFSFFTSNPKGMHAIKFRINTTCYLGCIRQFMELISKNIYQTSYFRSVQTADTYVLNTLRHFRAEGEAHVRLKVCPSGE